LILELVKKVEKKLGINIINHYTFVETYTEMKDTLNDK